MKNIALKLSTIVIIVLVAIILYLRECKPSPEFVVPENHTLVHNEVWEAFKTAAEAPRDTVFTDTGSTHIVIKYLDRPVPTPVEIKPEMNLYQDSIKTDTFSFWIEAMVRGTIEYWNWTFDITRQEIITIVEIPRPVPVEVPVRTSQAGIYASVGLGGTHNGKLGAGPRLDLITKKEKIYGIAYTRIGSDNFYEFRFGTRLFNNRK